MFVIIGQLFVENWKIKQILTNGSNQDVQTSNGRMGEAEQTPSTGRSMSGPSMPT